MHQIEFTTDGLEEADRFPAFADVSQDFRISPIGPSGEFYGRISGSVFHPVIAAEFHVSRFRCWRNAELIAVDTRDHYSVTLLLEGGAEGLLDGEPFQYAAGDGLVLDLTRPMEFTTAGPTRFILLLIPCYFLDQALPGIELHAALPGSPALATATDVVRALLARAESLYERTASYCARILRDAVAAALAPLHDRPGTRQARQRTVLEQMIRLIDDDLRGGLDTSTLCARLHTSRSTLYRAARGVGGVENLIRRRRLLAVHRLLRDPYEVRPIEALAYACGFRDFRSSIQFGRGFGETPGNVRAQAQPAACPSYKPDELNTLSLLHKIVEDLAIDRGEPRFVAIGEHLAPA